MQRVLESNRHSTIIRSMGVPAGEVPDDLKYSKAKFEFPGSIACQKSVVNVTSQLKSIIVDKMFAAFPVRLPKHGFLTKASLVVKVKITGVNNVEGTSKRSIMSNPGRDLFDHIEWRTETAQTLSALHREASYASSMDRSGSKSAVSEFSPYGSVRYTREAVADGLQWTDKITNADDNKLAARLLADTNYSGRVLANDGEDFRTYLGDRLVGTRWLNDAGLQALSVSEENLTFVVPINFRMFERLYTCPDLMSLEQTELMFHPSSKSLGNDVQFEVSSAELQLWYSDISPSAHDSLLRELHGGGGSPFNYFGTHTYKEAVASQISGQDLTFGPPDALVKYACKRQFQIELRCENPVRKTYIIVESKDPIKSESMPITSVEMSDSGTVLFRSASAHELVIDQDGGVNGATSSNTRMYVIDWSREKFLKESSLNSVGTAISFQQMTNPTLTVSALDTTLNYNLSNGAIPPTFFTAADTQSKMTVVHETYRAYSIAPRPDMRDRTIQVIQNK